MMIAVSTKLPSERTFGHKGSKVRGREKSILHIKIHEIGIIRIIGQNPTQYCESQRSGKVNKLVY